LLAGDGEKQACVSHPVYGGGGRAGIRNSGNICNGALQSIGDDAAYG